MKKQEFPIEKNIASLIHKNGITNFELIKSQLNAYLSDKDLFKKTLVQSGILNKDFRLNKHYK